MSDAARSSNPIRPTSSTAEERAKQLESALLDAARERAYSIGHSRHRPGHWQFTIQGTDVQWLVYERSIQRKVPLTAKEKKDWRFSHVAERGWQRVLVPSGWLVLLVSGDYQHQIRIEEKTRAPLIASEILARLERMGAYGAAERERRDQEERLREKRAAERQRSRGVEEDRWEALNDVMDDLERAQRLRRFIDTVASHSPQRPDQARRVRKWKRWATAHANSIDPMANGFDDLLASLGLPK